MRKEEAWENGQAVKLTPIAQRRMDLFINNPVEHNEEIKIDPVDLSGINCVIPVKGWDLPSG